MKYYKPEEIASILKVKPKEIYQFLESNKLNYVKMGSNYMVDENEVNSFRRKYYHSYFN